MYDVVLRKDYTKEMYARLKIDTCVGQKAQAVAKRAKVRTVLHMERTGPYGIARTGT